MNPFGDGSSGALNVASGTQNLALDTKHQFTTVNIAAGATLSTNSTSGAVLYITATQSITVNGDINVSNKVLNGQRNWSTTIDGVTYNTPSVSQGGAGALYTGQTVGMPAAGNGGGGGGGGGSGGNGSNAAGAGGSRPSVTRTGAHFNATVNGGKGGGSAGGGGRAYVFADRTSGDVVLTLSAVGGRGGNAYGENGENAVSDSISYTGSGNANHSRAAYGGGGAGGRAGKAGVHVVLIAPSVVINGTIITRGTNGSKGGNGGRDRANGGWMSSYAMGGGGGGGGNGGNIIIKYAQNLIDSGTYSISGGSAGSGGVGGPTNSTYGNNGVAGVSGYRAVYQIKPVSDFAASPLTGSRPLTVSFTNKSLGATSYSWNFGDSTGSSEANPSHTYSTVGTFTVTLTASNAAGDTVATKTALITTTIAELNRSISGSLLFGGDIDRELTAYRSITGGLKFGGQVRMVVLKDVEALPDKKYLYKVYDENSNYVEVWKDVISDPEFTREINEIGSSMTLELARNSDSLGVTSAPLLTENDLEILTEDNKSLMVSTETRNQIGDDSSVQYNYRVDIYAYYGQVSPLLTEDDEFLMTEDDESLLVDEGAPNGRRIFSGFISEINTRYGNSDTTIVQLSSYGWDLGQFKITDGSGNTTVAFNSFDPSDIVRNGIDKFVTDSVGYGTYTHRTESSISTTGTVVSYTFKNNNYDDLLAKALELAPSNWYYFVDLGTNEVIFRERSTTPKHLFYLGKHLKAVDLKGSILQAYNHVAFTGGGDPALYRDTKVTPAPHTRRTLSDYSDNRVTLATSADIIADGIIESGNKVQYRTTIEVLTKVYDIESIQVGDMVGFRNFGNYVDDLMMQVVGISYSPDLVQLQLDTKPKTVNKRLEDIYRNLKLQENINVPVAPS